MELLKLLLDKWLITKNEYPYHSLDCLGAIVAGRLLHKYHSQIFETLSRNLPTLPIVDNLLDEFNGDYITRSDTIYIFDCATCALRDEGTEFFFETFLEIILTHLGYETHHIIPQTPSQKYLRLKSSRPNIKVYKD